ncbi:MAG: DUF4232 domain-containing protein [Actinomycetota bacterium]
MPDLRGRFQRLDEIPVPDLRNAIEDREQGAPFVPDATSTRRRVIAGVVAFAVFAAAGIFTWRAFAPGAGDDQVAATSGIYRDPAGWTIHVPRGWHVVPFDVSDPSDGSRLQGVQLSNVELPMPAVGWQPAPPNRAASSFPRKGVAVIVARTSGSPGGDEIPLPLSLDAFVGGSAPPGAPVLDVAYFAAGGWTFVSTVKVGAHAYDDATLRTVGEAVASFRFPQPSTPACGSSQLSGRMAGSEGAAGTAFMTIGLRNVSTSPCHLEGSPTVEMLSPSGTSLPIGERSGLPEGPSLEASPVVLRAGEEASVVVAFSDVNVGQLPCLEAGSLSITPTGSADAIEIPLAPSGQVCDRTVWVAPFAASNE